jgi:phage gpG-like protein
MTGFAQVVTLTQLATAARSGALLPVGGANARTPPVPPAAQKAGGVILVNDVKGRIRDGTDVRGRKFRPLKFSRPGGGNQPLRDTGRLEASFTATADANGWTVSTTHPGAKLLNSGGVVRPKKGKFLAIPLTKEAKRAGSPRRLKGTPKTPLFARKKNGRWVGHFLLVRKVTLPAREFMGVSDRAAALVGGVVLDAYAKQWLSAKT